MSDYACVNIARGLRRLGPMEGKTELDWVDALKANPVAITELAGGQRLLQWRTGTYDIQTIAVVFDAANRFVKVSARYNV